ncbi:tripartite tricarboxylate transporter substrate-binding protein, partial [Citrobacter freundii]|uniref:tripartite tricarboxylate transporter substrate-binding protein n=1 Tax=Citrobacter freundii TaxID=546 RepID=UPI001952CCE2
YAVWAPAGTPKEIVEKFHAKVTELTATPEMQAKLRQVSAAPRSQTIAQMTEFLVNDMKNNADLIKAANIKLE